MFEHEGIKSKEDKTQCIRDAVKSISFENSHLFAYELYHKDKEVAKAVLKELIYWIPSKN